MSIRQLAIDLKKAGWSEEAIRDELRSTITVYGESPTCSAVEEAISFANPPLNPPPKGGGDK